MHICERCHGCGWENPAQAVDVCPTCKGSGVVKEETKTMHIMLDLETWGKRPGCDIRSIGAVVFDPVAGTVAGFNYNRTGDFHPLDLIEVSGANQFYIATYQKIYDIDDAPGIYDVDHFWMGEGYVKYPLTRDPETVQWWNDQTAEAQAAFANPVDLHEALTRFTSWLDAVTFPETEPGEFIEAFRVMERSNVRIWANGPQFDVSILEAVFVAVGLSVPWHYRAPRDFRTITDAAGMTHDDFCNYGTAHNALDDAIAQAMTVCEAYKRLGLQK